MGLSITGYAKRRGISQPAVSKAVKAGRITLLADGTIDPELADKQWAGSVSRVNTHKKIKSEPKATTINAVEQKADLGDSEVTDSDVSPDAIAELQIPDGLSLTDIKAIHETIKARQSHLNLMKDRSELTDLDFVNKQLFTISRNIRDGWLNWVNQVAGDMAAELKVNQHEFTILLEKKIKSHLEEIAANQDNVIRL